MYQIIDKKEHRKILNRLPNYQHYYNKLNYNKVDYLYCYAVPFGKKYLATQDGIDFLQNFGNFDNDFDGFK